MKTLFPASRTLQGSIAALAILSMGIACIHSRIHAQSASEPADATASAASLRIESVSPASPAQLKAGERLTVKIQYQNPAADSVQIWARPYTNGAPTRGYGAHGSPAYKKGNGTAEGWFMFDKAAAVDEVRVSMVERTASGSKVIATATMPVKASWAGGVLPVADARPKKPAGNTPASPPRAMAEPPDATKPVDMKFTALDGREVDLAKMRGKVVLIDFWATWCGPCIGEVPHMKAAYEKFHDKGFEIVGISFDEDRDALEAFIKAKATPWPQYFDGGGWRNKFGVQYKIRGIPTMWLIGKDGKLASDNARADLAGQVEKLLAQ